MSILGTGLRPLPVAAAPVTITYAHDGAGRLNAVHYGDSSAIGYRYDAAGNLLERVVSKNVQLVPAVFRDQISSGTLRTLRFVVDGSMKASRILYSLPAGRGGQCQANLTIVRPDGSRVEGLAIESSQQERQEAALEGLWTLRIEGLGGCSAQAFQIDVLPGSLVGENLGGLMGLGLLVFATLVLVLRRRGLHQQGSGQLRRG